MKLKLIFLVLFVFFPIVSGCWDYEEYEDIEQISALGIDFDKKSQDITITLQYIPTTKTEKSTGGTSGGSSSKTAVVHSVTDKTIYEALAKSQEVIYKKLFFGYTKVFVIGEEAAKYKMADIIELLDRTPVIRPGSVLAITSGKAADAISTTDAAMVTSSSEKINNVINLGHNTGAAYRVTVHDFTMMLAVPGIEATAPRVITVSNTPKPDAKGGAEGNIRYDEERLGDHRVAGIAAFKKDKFVGWLNERESLGFGWITGKNILSYKTSDPSGKTDSNEQFFYRLIKSKGKIKVRINNGEPVFQVDVKVIANMRKYYSNQGSDLLTAEEISVMENKLSESVRTDIEAALKKSQKKLKSDIFGFGLALFRKDWKLWRSEYEKKWDKIYPDIPVTVNVEAKIINTGTNNRRLDIK